MDCTTVQQKLKAYLDQELQDKEAQALMVHLQSCTQCAYEAEALSRTWELLRELPEPDRVPDLIPATLARIRSAEKESFRERVSRWLTLIPGPAVAATALALGIYVGTSIGTSISQNYSAVQEQEDPLYLEVFTDVPPQTIGDAYLSINEEKKG